MYLVNSRLLKSSKLTNDYLEIENLMKNFSLGPPYDATIDINNALLHKTIQKINFSNVFLQI